MTEAITMREDTITTEDMNGTEDMKDDIRI